MAIKVTTACSIDGERVKPIGLVTGEAVIGINFIKDWIASIKDTVGGRCHDYEDVVRKGDKEAISMMVERAQKSGANAIVGVRIEHSVLSPRGKGTMLMFHAIGTAAVSTPISSAMAV